ncbi:hypothetical protein ACLI4Z_18830 [Natrialbaceae archaeon A-arb3/5]
MTILAIANVADRVSRTFTGRGGQLLVGVDGVIEGGPGISMGTTKYPAQPTAFIESFADHGVRIDLNFWVERPYLPRMMRSILHEEVWNRLEDANVEIAYPHTHLVFDETSGTARVAVEDEHGEAPTDAVSTEEQAAD